MCIYIYIYIYICMYKYIYIHIYAYHARALEGLPKVNFPSRQWSANVNIVS